MKVGLLISSEAAEYRSSFHKLNLLQIFLHATRFVRDPFVCAVVSASSASSATMHPRLPWVGSGVAFQAHDIVVNLTRPLLSPSSSSA